jgi:hypothetical protein
MSIASTFGQADFSRDLRVERRRFDAGRRYGGLGGRWCGEVTLAMKVFLSSTAEDLRRFLGDWGAFRRRSASAALPRGRV